MAEESDLERTEAASARRLEQAREQGQVPRSREVGAFLVLITGAGVCALLGPSIVERLSALFRRALIVDSRLAGEPSLIVVRLFEVAVESLFIFAPLLAALLAAALLSPFLVGSWNFSPAALAADLGRLDPLKGLARLFSWTALAELVKAVAKAVLLGGVAAWVLWTERGDLLAMFGQSVAAGLANSGQLLSVTFLIIVSAMLLIVAVDVPFQIWQYHEQLKMSRQEVRQESRELEGNPEIKGRIRQLQREAARRRMMAAVPSADVVVTNPGHYAVALAYRSGMAAPRVLAKGIGEIALRIRQLAADHGVPLVEAPALARALYRHVELDEDIPSVLYAAVAEVLAYIYQLSRWRETGVGQPVAPGAITVPDGLDPEAANG
ncbi:flagellar biosynthesis protein FlhB [Accumulibacter sp.]|uniref:flagellar biosynthesis protein FlhB n=1 Tax=Accumulibacter sp. TaxID=2053492 RepID=UPI0025F2A9C9|nr:flagellar biosynthesis protein FlhB [Accumulibacter sp.]MCM8596226.1 flagellar biosynthesis protein FlhB [Accumulibacter sp.]MCM8627157.1 flagellar biosynthesis protein FlhB [Accumulibacter sp.]MDS4050375.1 flagellar biosynthesis protein FlhB [Accumulibacter sp.]